VKAFVVIALLASTAHARPISFDQGDEDDDENVELPTKLGFRLGVGTLPLGIKNTMFQFALGVEHPVFGELRMLAEYEFLWISSSEDYEDPMAARYTSMGHRTNFGVRRTVLDKRFSRKQIELYVDFEAGGGIGLYDVPDGSHIVPHVFGGIRLGYRIGAQERHGSKVLETEILLRPIIVEDGVGFGGGFGFYWGD